MANKISIEDSQTIVQGLEAIAKMAEVVARLELTHGQIFNIEKDEFLQRFESEDHAKRIRELTAELNQALPTH